MHGGDRAILARSPMRWSSGSSSIFSARSPIRHFWMLAAATACLHRILFGVEQS